MQKLNGFPTFLDQKILEGDVTQELAVDRIHTINYKLVYTITFKLISFVDCNLVWAI